MMISSDTHPFAPYVRILGKGKKGSRDLTQEEAHDAMSMIMRNEVRPEQLGAFLMLMRKKEETPAEMAGFCTAVQAQWTMPEVSVDIDWSCYAGKRRHLPWFILSQCLLWSMGYRLFVHGARGHTQDRIYAEDAYRALGLPVAEQLADITRWDGSTLLYCPLSVLSPMLETIIQLRGILGLRSPVHSFARLLNPMHATTVLQAIFHPGYHDIHQHAAALLNYPRCLVMKGDGGEFERNPDADLTLFWAQAGETTETELPPVFSRRHTKPAELDIQQLVALWDDTISDEYATAAVLHTAALAVHAHTQHDYAVALQQVTDAWQQRSSWEQVRQAQA